MTNRMTDIRTEFLEQFIVKSGDGLNQSCTDYESFTHSQLAQMNQFDPGVVCHSRVFHNRYVGDRMSPTL